MFDIVGDLRHSLRTASNAPGQTAVIVMTLAMAIGISTIGFAFADTVFLRGLPIADPERTVIAYGITAREPDRRGGVFFNDYLDLREKQWNLLIKALDEVQDTTDIRDLWASTLAVALESYDALPMIGRGAVAAYPKAGPTGPGPWNAAAFFHHKGQYQGREMSVMEMKARQQAWAVKRVERMWRQAWDEATRTGKGN